MNATGLALQAVDAVFREESGRILATLIRLCGDFDLAEDAMQDAFAMAIGRWPREGIPPNPGAWITLTARRKAIDRLRREKLLGEKQAILERLTSGEATMDFDEGTQPADDRLRLIFTCCHPALAPESQVALTLRTLCGLTTAEIARAFLVPEPTLAQRLVRTRKKIRLAGIPYRVPPDHLLPERLQSVLLVIYLVFNEGYAATSGDALVRLDLATEAIRLGRMLATLMPDEPEVLGLLALMLLHDARRDARSDRAGNLVLLEHQDRSLWHVGQIDAGTTLLDRAIRMRRPGPYQVQAAIAALHCGAADREATDWAQIVALYDRLLTFTPTPVVALNRAVAIAMARTPGEGLALLDDPALADPLSEYAPLHAARADLLHRAARSTEAVAAYGRAAALTTNESERRYLLGRAREVTISPS